MARWVKQWEVPEDHWLNSDLRYIGAWYSLIQMAEPKNRKIIRHGTMVHAERGNVYTSINALSEKWRVTRRFVRHFLEMLEQDSMITVQQADNRGITLKVNNYAKYQDKPNNKRTTDSTTDSTTEDTTEDTTDGTTEASFFLTNNKEYTEYTEGERRTQHFVPPTMRDVEHFCSENNLNIDAERFVNYYEARGWKGIRNWKAAVRSWVARDGTKPQAKKFDNFEPRETTGSAMDEYLKRLEEGYD